jgi:hypothetical protein
MTLIRRTMGLALVVALAGLLLVPGSTVSQAQQAKLVTTHVGGGKYMVEVHGLGATTAPVRVHGWGDALFFDDPLFCFESDLILPGGEYIASAPIPRRFLNEDWGRDEIYGIVDLGSTSIRTNTVRGSF